MDHQTRIFTAFYSSLLFSTFFLSIQSQSVDVVGIRSNKTEIDRLALLAFKSKITDDPFQVLTSWNNSQSFCKWKGVTCSPRRQRVIKLNLFSQSLVGTLSPHIGNLTFLSILDLQNNSLHGEIPPEIGRLYWLRNLGLTNNSFVGIIPGNISGCTNLEELHLGNNKLQGKIPIELSSLSKLVWLALLSNNLTGEIPPFIGNLSLLQVVSLGENSLEGSIPHSLLQLKSMWYIGIFENMLSGTVPPLLYNISSLTSVVLHENQLTGSLPPSINLPNLQDFLISGNNFSGTLPVSLFNSSGLQQIDISTNSFSGKVPVEVGNLMGLVHSQLGSNRFGSGKIDDLDFLNTLTNCSNLQMLDIEDNLFRGQLPNSVANFSNQLSYLYMGENQLHGSIPSGIQNFPNLILLAMEENLFTGSIPLSIGILRNLQALYLNGNILSGQLPSSLWNISHLFDLDLSYNLLEGSIKSDITKNRFLHKLVLSHNNFNGTLPEGAIGSLAQLTHLDISHNSLIGSLPTQLGNFENLQLLDISENKMSGEIPSTIGGCWSLQNLSLKGNFFRGPIPTSLKALKDIRNLDLSMNNLSGKIPNELGSLPSLQNLNLSFNNLEGRVPTEGVFKNKSAFSILGNDKLCGGIDELHIPTCHSPISKKEKMHSSVKVILGVVISSIVVVSLAIVAFCWRKKPKQKPSSEPIAGAHFERVSYHDLYQATNGFSLGNLIGVGSFGSVYKGILHEDEGHVAVKVINLIEQGASKSFITECDASRKIRHRNLLKILTICSSVDFKGNDFKALVLKFMSNGSPENFLHPRLDGKLEELNLFKRLNIAIDIASALDYLHNHCETPIVHCDIKPSNILLDEDMTAYVGDFGLTKFLPNNTSSFNTSESNLVSAKGTIGYIPPEYGIGVAQVSTQGDVYSYGILLLEMFTGKKPTDEMFKDGLTLHHFSSVALPLRAMDIVDPQMLLWEDHDHTCINSAHQSDINYRVQECIVSIFQVGVACSVESQSERIGINEALMKLHVIKEVFLGARMIRDPKHRLI